jgi:hypothetical protein
MKSILALLLFVPVFVVAQDKSITYTARAIPLRVVLDDLSKQSGMKLRAEAQMEQEPLILRLDNAPMKDVMAKMADVFQADWVDHKDYWRLERSEDKVTALRERAFQEKAQKLKDGIDYLVQMEERNGPLDAKGADNLITQAIRFDLQHKNDTSMRSTPDDFARDSQLPHSRLGVKLLALMDPAELAKIKDGDHVVYSTSPNSTQRQFPQVDPAIIDSWMADMKTYHDAYDRVKPNFESMWAGEYQAEADLPKSKPTRLVVTIESYGSGIAVATFTLFGDKDEHLADDGESIGSSAKASFDHRAAMAKLTDDARKNGFALSDIQKEISTRGNQVPGQTRPLSAEAINTILNPTKIDPLALGTSDTVLIGSQLQNLNAIALVPDSDIFYAGYAARDGKTTLAKYISMLWRSATDAQIDNGWLVVKPVDAQSAQDERMPRNVLEEFLKRSMAEGIVSIDAAADLRASLSTKADLGLAAEGVSNLLGMLAADAINAYDPTLSRFFGLMGPKDRSMAQVDTYKTTFEALTDDQRDLIHTWLYGNNSYLQSTQSSNKTNTWEHDVTDLIPNGIAPDSPISVTDRIVDTCFVTQQTQNGSSYATAMSDDYLVQTIARTEHPELFPEDNYSTPTGFRTGKQRVVTIRIDLDGKYQDSGMLTENHPASDTDLSLETYLKQLPDDTKKALLKKVNDLVNNMRQYRQRTPGAGGSGTGAKPPL